MADQNKTNTSSKKKDKVLHTRVPDTLEEELKTRASSLGISVSNLVRNILDNAFNLVEDVINDSSNIGRAVSQTTQHPKLTSGRHDESSPTVILGWQKLKLNVNAVCSTCNTIMEKGSEAAIGVASAASPTTFLCLSCLKNFDSQEN